MTITTRDRVAELHRDSLRRQLGRPVLEAARLAQDPGQPLSRYILAQCELRGIDPIPHLREAGITVLHADPVICDTHGLRPHPELSDCRRPTNPPAVA